MRPVVHSTKHLVQTSLSTIVAGAVTSTTLAIAVPIADKNLVTEVEEGAVVKACYVEDWLRTADTAGGSFVYIIVKHPSATNNPTAVEMAALSDWDNKKNILFTSMGLLNDQDADATPITRGWYKVPKGKQRFGLGDTLKIHVFAQSLDLQRCGFALYKEYT